MQNIQATHFDLAGGRERQHHEVATRSQLAPPSLAFAPLLFCVEVCFTTAHICFLRVVVVVGKVIALDLRCLARGGHMLFLCRLRVGRRDRTVRSTAAPTPDHGHCPSLQTRVSHISGTAPRAADGTLRFFPLQGLLRSSR